MFWNKEISVLQRYPLHWKHVLGREEKNNLKKLKLLSKGFILHIYFLQTKLHTVCYLSIITGILLTY